MKSKYLIWVIAAVIVIGGLFYFVQKNTKTPAPVSSGQDEEVVAENPTYQHIHSVFKMPDGTILLGAHTGLFKSTDFGLTWSKADIGIDGQDIHGLAINPLDPNRIYAYSVNKGLFGTQDGAKSWNKIDDGPKNPNMKGFVYMPTFTGMDRNMRKEGSTNIGYLWAGTGGGLFSSFACFCGWTPAQSIPTSVTVYALAADPANKSAMLVAEKDGLYRTTDEAKTFTKVSSELKDVGALWFDITDPKVVFAATNAGVIYQSDDSGMSWQKK